MSAGHYSGSKEKNLHSAILCGWQAGLVGDGFFSKAGRLFARPIGGTLRQACMDPHQRAVSQGSMLPLPSFIGCYSRARF